MNFRFENAYEVFVNNRKFLYKGSKLFHIRECDDNLDGDNWRFQDWCGAPVENPVMIKLFKNFRRNHGKDLRPLYKQEIHYSGIKRVDRWEEVIMAAVQKFSNGFRFKDLYYDIAMQLGADSEEDARKGWGYHPYTGKRIQVERCFGTWITERSPDSRNRYIRGGQLTFWTDATKPLLFVNPVLREANHACQWKPFNERGKRNLVRGDRWFYNPLAAQQVLPPHPDVLEQAERDYRVKGMQGKRQGGPESYDTMGIRV
jgi:hypothetical protein